MANLPDPSTTPQAKTYKGDGAISACIVGVLLFAGAALRLRGFSRLGLTHFDEGVYAFSGFWPFPHAQNGALYPLQKLFSPPAYFGLLGIVNWFRGRALDLNAIAINVVLGSLTVLLVFWAGSRFFGTYAGISACALTALGELHIAFSRTALTDTGFSFFFLLALALIAICIEKESLYWAIAAGLAVGIAWNFKYHGWLLIVFALPAVLLKALRNPIGLKRTRALLLCWFVILVVGAMCFLPWLLFVQYRLGGYAAVEKFHGIFLNFRWFSNLGQLAEMQRYFDGWISRISPAIAFLCGALSSPHRFSSEVFRWCVAILFFTLLLLGALFTGFGACLLLAALSIPMLWRANHAFGNLLLCSLLILFVLTPCYKPYARLTLPWSLMILPLAGLSFQQMTEGERWHSTWERIVSIGRWKLTALSACGILVAVTALSVFQRPAPRTWMATASARDDAPQMAKLIPHGSSVLVLGEPEIAFYFKQAGLSTYCFSEISELRNFLVQPSLYSSDAHTFVAVGFYGRMVLDWDTIARKGVNLFRLVSRLSFQPSDVRLVDDFPPKEALSLRSTTDPPYDLLLYEFQAPKPASSNSSKQRD